MLAENGSVKRLIVNADGFGFGPGATQGIMDAIREGRFISSVSVNANFSDAARIRDLVAEFPGISVGVHLNAMVGRPCLPPDRVPSLVGSDGCFQNGRFLARLRRGDISQAQLEAEFDAQIAAVKDLAGDRLTHLDSQENTHVGYLGLFLKLAARWRVGRIRTNASVICYESTRPWRSRMRVYFRRPHVWAVHRYRRWQMSRARAAGMRMADHLITVGYAGEGNKANPDNWIRMLKNLPGGTFEIYCHPAYPDDTLRRWSVYCEERAQELAILRSKDLREIARRAGVEIVSFDAI